MTCGSLSVTSTRPAALFADFLTTVRLLEVKTCDPEHFHRVHLACFDEHSSREKARWNAIVTEALQDLRRQLDQDQGRLFQKRGRSWRTGREASLMPVRALDIDRVTKGTRPALVSTLPSRWRP